MKTAIEKETTESSNIFEQLQKAKENVRWLLDHESGSVDFRDLVYWSQVVINLRKKIRGSL